MTQLAGLLHQAEKATAKNSIALQQDQYASQIDIIFIMDYNGLIFFTFAEDASGEASSLNEECDGVKPNYLLSVYKITTSSNMRKSSFWKISNYLFFR